LSALAPPDAGGYRVLWLGDPSVLPLPGWTVAPGLEAATSNNGLPGGDTLFSAPDSGTTDQVLSALKSAIAGRTVRLGQLLAPAGISTIVVMNASAPELAGVQSVPLHPVPAGLTTALGLQTDLSLELQTSAVVVFANSMYRGLVSQSAAGSVTSTHLLASGVSSSTVSSDSTIRAGVAPASAFELEVNGSLVPRSVSDGWVPTYHVGNEATTATAQLVLHRFPWNGILAGFTLLLWAIVWLGFGLIQRLEWLFTGRRRQVVVARHARKDDRG
ncbi:MAG TPA: hypothetical protein VGE75_05900, partial [Acidimicrobiales bacterium]